MFPADIGPEFYSIGIVFPGVEGGVESGFAYAIKAPGVDGIELRDLFVVESFPGLCGSDCRMPVKTAERDGGQLSEHGGPFGACGVVEIVRGQFEQTGEDGV